MEREIIDAVLQVLAAATLILGLWLAGGKLRSGPAIAAFSELLWIAVGWMHGVWGLMALSVVLFAVQLRAYVKWGEI